MELIKTFDSVDARFGTAGPLLVALYRGSASLAMLDELDRTQDALLRKFTRISTLTVIGQASGMFKVDEAVRTRSVELGKKFDGKVTGSAIVVNAKGLAAVMVRTFLTGFFLLSRAETPMKTFSKISEGLSWLQSFPDQDVGIKTQLSETDIERFIA
ncbi:MAG: hypothetical protein Q8N23_13720 [Archangium sp.]|nr:hypothetical protein [Archangium sp.]MDP3153731.1 hypothetical protein [Archangium sp.]MDP3569220.1 hypothetical protein [Archangium sp.]